ncbi:hypothetical protein HDU67_008456 [Dinochytrium kinnereticum]|nr:hypothetical protein HDU67_008456 [Dinochytrium kinnereticum]
MDKGPQPPAKDTPSRAPTHHVQVEVKLPQRGSSLQASSPTSPVTAPPPNSSLHPVALSTPRLDHGSPGRPILTHQRPHSQTPRTNVAGSAPILNIAPPSNIMPPHSLQSSSSFNSTPSTAGAVINSSNSITYASRGSSDIPRFRERDGVIPVIPVGVQGFPVERSRVGSIGSGDFTSDAAWQAICAKVLPLFNGEGLKGSIEDLNELVSIWLNEMLIQQINPSTDMKELLAAGMLNLGNRIVTVGDEALTLRLVELWSFFFGTVVPYVQGVFLPLRTRYRPYTTNRLPGRPFVVDQNSDIIDIRNMALVTFRDMIILPMSGRLEALFPRILIDVANDRRLQDISSRLIHMLSILLNASAGQGLDDRSKRCKDLLIFLRNTLLADAEDTI